MPTKVHVTHIDKRDHRNAHQRLKSIGGISDEGQWKVSEPQAIAAIRSGTFHFVVIIGGRDVDIVVASYRGRSYLKTAEDDYAPDNLLNLPAYPAPSVVFADRFAVTAECWAGTRSGEPEMPVVLAPFIRTRRAPQGRRRRD